MGERTAGTLFIRLHPRVIRLCGRPIRCVRCNHAHYPRRRIFSPLCARSVRRVLSSVAALPKRLSASPNCCSGGSTSYSGHRPAMQGHYAVLKPEVGEVMKISGENEEALVCRDPRAVKRSRRKKITFLLVFSSYSPPSLFLGPRCAVSASAGPLRWVEIHRQVQGGFIRILFCTVSVPLNFVLRLDSSAAVPSDVIYSILRGLWIFWVGWGMISFLSCPWQLQVGLTHGVL